MTLYNVKEAVCRVFAGTVTMYDFLSLFLCILYVLCVFLLYAANGAINDDDSLTIMPNCSLMGVTVAKVSVPEQYTHQIYHPIKCILALRLPEKNTKT